MKFFEAPESALSEIACEWVLHLLIIEATESDEGCDKIIFK